MPTTLPLRCRCGSLRGVATDLSPRTGTRIVCLCGDCRAYARFLDNDAVLDVYGGTDIFQLTPSQVQITAGAEHLRCVRLFDKGMMRWFAGCCKTPVANTFPGARFPFAGIVHSFMDHTTDGRSRDSVLGPVIATIHAASAEGTPPPGAHRAFPPALVLRTLRFLGGAFLRGKHKPSPFFNVLTGAPVAPPQVLPSGERERLRAERA